MNVLVFDTNVNGQKMVTDGNWVVESIIANETTKGKTAASADVCYHVREVQRNFRENDLACPAVQRNVIVGGLPFVFLLDNTIF